VFASSSDPFAMVTIVSNCCRQNLKINENVGEIWIRNESTEIPLYLLQLNDVELSCLLKVVLEFVEMVGGQNVLRGTEIHPVFSPSRARASSKMNFPSETELKNYSRFSPTSATRDEIIIIHNDVLFRRVCCSFFFNFHIVLRGTLQESTLAHKTIQQ
jgi:hypothetical protein